MNPHLSSAVKILISTFIGAFLGYLQPFFVSGLPPQAQWKPMLAVGLFTAIFATYHEYNTSPITVSAQRKLDVQTAAVNAATVAAAPPAAPVETKPDLVAIIEASTAEAVAKTESAKTDPTPPTTKA